MAENGIEADRFQVEGEPWFYTRHAIRRINQRGISTREIREVMLDPSWRCQGSNKIGKNSIKLVKERPDGSELHVSTAIIEGVTVVVTAFVNQRKK